MVRILPTAGRGSRRGALSTECVVAVAILVAAVLPIAAGWVAEARALRASYTRAVAMEIVDGELEVLAAGGWKQLRPGAQEYQVRSRAAVNLPPGRFTAMVTNKVLRLEWKSLEPRGVGAVVREVKLP